MLAVSYLDRGPSLQRGELDVEGAGCCLAPCALFAGVVICAGTSVAHAALSLAGAAQQHPAHLRVAAF